MDIRDLLWLTGRQLKLRLLESVLIVLALGLGIGVASTLIILSSYTKAQSASWQERVSFGAMRVTPTHGEAMGAPLPAVKMSPANGPRARLTMALLETLKRETPAVGLAYGMGGNAEFALSVKEGVSEVSPPSIVVTRVTADFLPAMGAELQAGSYFTGDDVDKARRVLVMGDEAVSRYLPGTSAEDAVGAKVQFQLKGEFTVIGVLAHTEPDDAPQELSTGPGKGPNMIVVAPITSVWESWIPLEFYELRFMPKPGMDGLKAIQQFRANLRRLYGDKYTVASDLEAQRESRKRSRGTSMVLAIVGSAALSVAILNVLNLMVTRVLRRTKNIATVRALGASAASTFGQVMCEALLLTLGGLAVGALVASAFTALLGRYLSLRSIGAASLPHLTLGTSLATALLSACVGLALGAYPAWLASRAEPAEALKE